MTANFFLSVLLPVVFFVVSDGCSCYPTTQQAAYNQADFIGRMRIVTKTYGDEELTYTADYIDPTYKPPNQPHIFIPVPIVTGPNSAACGVTELKIGKDYLVSGARNGSEITITLCSGIPPQANQLGSSPGAVPWESVSKQLKKKLKKGKF